MNKAILFTFLLMLVIGDKILVIVDNKQLEQTHSEFLELLKGQRGHEVEIAHSFGKNNIELKYYDRFRYDHIVVMCTSDKGKNGITQICRVKSKQKILSHILIRVETSSSLEMLILPIHIESFSTHLEHNWMNQAPNSRIILTTMNHQHLSLPSIMILLHHSSLKIRESSLYFIVELV